MTMFDVLTAYGTGEKFAVRCDCLEWISEYYITVEPAVWEWARHRINECPNKKG